MERGVNSSSSLSLSEMPIEIVCHIMSFLNVADLSCCSAVCRSIPPPPKPNLHSKVQLEIQRIYICCYSGWAVLAADESLWRAICLRHWQSNSLNNTRTKNLYDQKKAPAELIKGQNDIWKCLGLNPSWRNALKIKSYILPKHWKESPFVTAWQAVHAHRGTYVLSLSLSLSHNTCVCVCVCHRSKLSVFV